ncbi:hypothetical protein [uncultured Litoreibacter sp.]|uniref:DUF6916 family protein n=1 Tax=uncultured Litoreibacter sp. TaxID=1392394 RepID=UPI0026117411|nr:hypothetical protein [uncultured Litoreibacter sp.]
MRFLDKVSRRMVLAGQAALAGLATLPSIATARSVTVGVDASGVAAAPKLQPRWDTATAEELAPFIGQRFRVKSAEHGNLVLKLISVEPGRSGAARPVDLARREAVTAVFDSPDLAPLVADQYGSYQVHHPQIGSAELYMTASPRRHGGNYVEVVLN